MVSHKQLVKENHLQYVIEHELKMCDFTNHKLDHHVLAYAIASRVLTGFNVTAKCKEVSEHVWQETVVKRVDERLAQLA